MSTATMFEDGSVLSDEQRLEAAIRRIVDSASTKKLVVAGPGTGKTTLFGALLDKAGGTREDNLVLTFINTLKDDLEADLGDRATVKTLHGYCLGLLYQQDALRGPLTPQFECVPGLAHLVKSDWEILMSGDAPEFTKAMRQMTSEDLSFYFTRGDYYDAVDYDDAVYRVCTALSSGKGSPGDYQLVLVDEYQDFNAMEAAFISFLERRSAIVLAGDDDQALYSGFRFASSDFIRSLREGGEYDIFELPFCLRCPEVIVSAVGDVLRQAYKTGSLEGRIDKPYAYFAPRKSKDSEKYPKIDVIKTSTQKKKVNYMGRYLDVAIRSIPQEEIDEAIDKGFPAALVISPKPYYDQVVAYLESAGYHLSKRKDRSPRVSRAKGLELLKSDSSSNVGWRILLELDRPQCFRAAITESYEDRTPLGEAISAEYRDSVLHEAAAWESPVQAHDDSQPAETQMVTIPITATSFEGAKGLSGQHVFVVGLHDGDLPRHSDAIEDLEICKFLVALTRTRKKCHLIYAGKFAGVDKSPSVFISWIDRTRRDFKYVDKKFWS